ncbi:cubilin-like [Physella acuta]|uniref:cubilin-like n=1 Tax=Physella acuta TaxID=109671 RepID=UPI0027DAD3DE|nr:cubilin-like [Physella acuta]
MFTFIHFDLGKRQTNPCAQVNDRLRIMESTPQGETWFCASPPMTTYISKTNLVHFNFITNGHSDAQGFKVVFKGDWPCRALLKSDRGEIASPQWPEQYSPGLNCAWTIQAPEQAKITLKFTTIDLDSQAYGGCTDKHDVIEVNDGSSVSDVRLARFCSHEAPAPLLSSGNTLYVTFKTDSYVQRTGFHASYDFIFPAKEATPSTTTPPPVFLDHSDDERLDRLGANFIEPQLKFPEAEVNITWDTKDLKFGIVGGEFAPQPKQRTVDGNYFTTDAYITILWIVLVSLLVLTVVLTLVLVIVCRHNRQVGASRCLQAQQVGASRCLQAQQVGASRCLHAGE